MIKIVLEEKPTSVSIRYNGYYKIVLLLAIINYCAYAKKASLDLLHIVFWALRNDTNFQVLYDVAKQNRKSLIPWTFEHGIDEVLALGLINEYIEKIIVGESLEIKITQKGINIIASINEFELFQEEIQKIRSFGIIPRTRLQSANNNWKLI
jgi:dimeric dUTPase (all-alpha-NTP-PPase superfamily)